jgi:hypothetical protein
MKTRICRSSGVVVCNSFRTYGNIPTDKAYKKQESHQVNHDIKHQVRKERSNNKVTNNYQIYGPRPHVKESSKKNQCPISMALTKQNLQESKFTDSLL